MSFATLALVGLASLAGPLLAWPKRWHVPVLLGELFAGVLLGPTLAGVLHAADPTFTFLGDMGFALVMFVAGSHVPVRDPDVRTALRAGAARAAMVGVVAVALAAGVASLFRTGHSALYAVLMASSSAALVLPTVDSLQLRGRVVMPTLAQVAVADTVCIVALPLAVDPGHAVRAGLGALAVIAAAGAVFAVLRQAELDGARKRLHRLSEQRKFALELRVSLVLLFGLAALAVRAHVSIMLAGFAFGLSVAAIGEPRRLARQLFALADGFLGPLFFVWLGASINLRELGRHPSLLALGFALGAGAVLAHTSARLLGQPTSMGALAAAQLGVPVAAATIGTQLHVLRPGESAALLLGALTTIAVATAGGAMAARSQATAATKPAAATPP